MHSDESYATELMFIVIRKLVQIFKSLKFFILPHHSVKGQVYAASLGQKRQITHYLSVNIILCLFQDAQYLYLMKSFSLEGEVLPNSGMVWAILKDISWRIYHWESLVMHV